MAKTGIHYERSKVYVIEEHNERKKKYLEKLKELGLKLYIFQQLTHLNKSWVNPEYAGKTVGQHFEDMCARYQEKTGQAPQLKDRERIDKKSGKKKVIAGWSPIREGVAPIEEDTQIEDFKPYIKWLKDRGLNVIRIDLHHDEGYEDEKGQMNMNHHAHIVVDWTDHDTGKTFKLGKRDMEEMQTVLAESLGMERGAPKAETGKIHEGHAEYREKKAAEHYKKLEKENQVLKDENQAIKKENQKFITNYKALVDKYSDLIKLLDTLNKDKTEKAAEVNKLNKSLLDIQNQINQRLRDLEEANERAKKAEVDARERERIHDEYTKEKTLLESINGQIAHARATAAAMGIDVKVNLRLNGTSWIMAATIGNASLPQRTVSHEDAVAFKKGIMPAEILVAKYFPNNYQASPQKVEEYVRNTGLKR